MTNQPWEEASAVLPTCLRQGLEPLADRLPLAEEYRLRRGQPLSVLLPTGEVAAEGPVLTEVHLRQVLEQASQHSAHTVLDRVQRGFVTLRGGHRIGLCGTAVRRDGQIITLQYLSSLSIRIARQVTGQAPKVLPSITESGIPHSTLILAPPGAGKTTLLRDLIRGISSGETGIPLRVGVADERGELAALWQGEPQMDIGPHTDVMDGCSKAEGISILLRGMNPQVVAVDEITERQDAEALLEAAGCGVALLATAHGSSGEDLRRRPVYRMLLEAGVFRRLIVIRCQGGRRFFRTEGLPC